MNLGIVSMYGIFKATKQHDLPKEFLLTEKIEMLSSVEIQHREAGIKREANRNAILTS